jgi:hypothetical protein
VVFEIYMKTASMVLVLLSNSKFYGIILLNALAILASVPKALNCEVPGGAHNCTSKHCPRKRKKERKKKETRQNDPQCHHHVCSNGWFG